LLLLKSLAVVGGFLMLFAAGHGACSADKDRVPGGRAFRLREARRITKR
jgi:hypothetical protein